MKALGVAREQPRYGRGFRCGAALASPFEDGAEWLGIAPALDFRQNAVVSASDRIGKKAVLDHPRRTLNEIEAI